MALGLSSISRFVGLWRWESRRGYVPLRIHSGGVVESVIDLVLDYVVLGETRGAS